MKKLEHISNLLNKNLNLIGSKLSLDSNSNSIGEQIATITIHDRHIEIIRQNEERDIWISFHYKTVSLGSNTTRDINNIVKSIYSFLELKVDLLCFYITNDIIDSPFDISTINNDEDILIELKWLEILEHNNSIENNDWLEIKRFGKRIKTIASSKGLEPFRSLNRLCFSLNTNQNIPCFWISEKKEYIIGYYNGKELRKGTENEIFEEFENYIQHLD